MGGDETFNFFIELLKIIISLPIILLGFIIYYRHQISEIITKFILRFESIEKIKLGDAEISYKTQDTILGETNVSVPIGKTPSSLGSVFIDGYSYFSRLYKFQISWPSKKWSPITDKDEILKIRKKAEEIGGAIDQSLETPIIILSDIIESGQQPNVSVTVTPVGNIPISQLINSLTNDMLKIGWTILSSSIDEKIGGGLLVFISRFDNKEFYQIMKVAVAFGKAYAVTATQLPSDKLSSQDLRKDLINILNSFELIK